MFKLLFITIFMVVGTASAEIEHPAENPVEISSEASARKPAQRYEQYNLRLNKVLSKDCRIVLFLNKNETHFIKMAFTPNSLVSFQEFMESQDERLKNNNDKFDLKETLGGENKNHIFSMEDDGNMYVRYQLLDPADQTYKPEDALIFENLACN